MIVPAQFNRKISIFVITALIPSGLFFLNLHFPILKTTPVEAETSVLETRVDWELGLSDGIDEYSSSGDIRLKADGTWTPLSLNYPPIALSTGTAVISMDGYTYALVGSDNYFMRYNFDEGKWESLATSPVYSGYGSDLAVVGDYIYAIFGEYQKEFARYSPGTNTWEMLPDLPDLVYQGSSIATDGDFIYANKGNGTTDFWRFNLETEAWEVLANSPLTLSYGASLEYYDGYVYTPRGSGTNVYYRYSVELNSWTTRAVVPVTVTGSGTTAIRNGEIYFLRSVGDALFYKYNIGTNTWSALASTPQLNRYVGLTYDASSDLMNVFRGNGTYDVWLYDPDTDQYLGPADTPAAAALNTGAGAVFHGGYLYTPRGGNVNNFYRYNLATNVWETRTAAPVAFNDDTKGVVAGDYIYYFRGSGTTTFYRYDINANTWATMAVALNTVTYGGGLTYPGSGDTIYAIRGGFSLNFWAYSILNDSWTALTNVPDNGEQGYGARVVSDGTYVYYASGSRTGSLFRYTLPSGPWAEISTLPYAPDLGTDLTYYSGKLIALAGAYRDEVWEYDISGNTWRNLPRVSSKYGYERGPQAGSALQFDGTSSLYYFPGNGHYNMDKFSLTAYDYAATGTWTSDPLDMYYVSSWGNITLDSSVPTGTSLLVETRTGSDQVTWSSWEALSGNSIQSAAARYIQVRVTLNANGARDETPVVSSITINYTGDVTAPSNPVIGSVVAKSQAVSGTTLTSGITYPYAHPYFTWGAGTDAASGVSGYYVYFGNNSGATPESDGVFQTGQSYTVTEPLSTGNYYLKISTVDNNDNVAASLAAFTYVYRGVSASHVSVTDTTVFNEGTADNVSTSNDSIKLQGRAGFWVEDHLTFAPANIYYGSQMAYVESNNKIYTARGSNTNTFYSYDVATDLWTTLATAPAAFNYGGNLVAGPEGYLYATRGLNTTSFWRYDIANNTWDDPAVEDAPQPLYNGSDLAYDGEDYIYLTRGNNDDAFMRYSITDDNWENLASIDFDSPANQVNNMVTNGGSIVVADDGLVYAIQGGNRTGFAYYDPSSNTWTALENTPYISGIGADITYDSDTNTIFFIGGNADNTFFSYDITSGIWSQLIDTPNNQYYDSSLITSNGYLYFLRAYNSTQFYKYNIEKESWTIPNMGLFRDAFRGTDYHTLGYGAEMIRGDGNNYYITRGNQGNNFIKYDALTGASIELANVPSGMYYGSSIGYDSVHNKIYLTPSYLNRKLFIYDIATNEWTVDSSDPPPLDTGYGASMAFDGTRYMYFTRGANTTGFYRYDTLSVTPGAKWETLAVVPGGLGYGANLVYKEGYLYTMRGANLTPNPLYRYSVSAGTWSTLASVADRIYNDGFLVDGGPNQLYACRGANTDFCYKYTISSNAWAAIEDFPSLISVGGTGANFNDEKMLVLAGSGTNSIMSGVYSYIMETSDTAFLPEGTYTSKIHNLTSVYRWGNLEMTYTPAANSSVVVETRTSANGTVWEAWTPSGELKTYGDNYQFNINSSANPYIQARFTLYSADGVYSGVISDYTIYYYQDDDRPSNPTDIDVYDTSSKVTPLVTDTWYSHSAPHFDWPDAEETNGASDTSSGSGVAGYYVYFGSNPLADPADPEIESVLTSESSYTASDMTPGSTNYLRIRTVDDAGNVSLATYPAFIYKYDNVAPTALTGLEADPSGYTSVDSFDFNWDVGVDTASGISQYCYKTGVSTGPLSVDQCTTATSVADITSYKSGANTFYLRARDNAGNYTNYSTVNYYFSTDAPSAPTDLSVTPTSNTENSFAFSWDIPDLYFGSISNLKYYYSINALPTSTSVTQAFSTFLSAGPYATLPGENTFYVVAKDESNNIDYNQYASVTFTANTTAPGIPTQLDIADVSVKSTSSWKIALSWEAPSNVGAGVASYRVYRSDDGGSTYSFIASTSGISYVDTRLEQITYNYRIRACDSANNCGADSAVVSLLPDGKFVEAAPLVGEPTITSITTRSAIVTWSTSRTADSKIAFGESSGDYFDEEVGNSEHVTQHVLSLSNLTPGTTYYFTAKWTDEDGNTGISEEYSFPTAPPPASKEISAINVGLYAADIQFTSVNGTKAKVYFGKSADFGGLKEIAIGTSESTYIAQLAGLEDGTKYYYKVNLFDIDGAEYEGDTYAFETLPEPKVTATSIQQVKSAAKPTVFVLWNTNTPVSSVITYYPISDPGLTKDAINLTMEEGRHRILITDLLPESDYVFKITGRDKAGNPAETQEVTFKTSVDLRPPLISDVKIESSIIGGSGNGEDSTAQLIVSWKTDEPATSQIEFGEGSGTVYTQKTQEDVNLAVNHLVVISNLSPSKVYHLRAVSKDIAGNVSESIDNVTITPKATDDALGLVITNLSEVFGFMGGLNVR